MIYTEKVAAKSMAEAKRKIKTKFGAKTKISEVRTTPNAFDKDQRAQQSK